MKRRFAPFLCCLIFSGAACLGQNSFPVTLPWPAENNPTLKFVVGKLQPSGLYNGQSIFVSDVTVQNLSAEAIPKSVFTIFINDKDGIRIGRGLLRFDGVKPSQTIKAQLQFSTAGVPAGATLLVGRTVPLKVVSIPPGADLKVDGRSAGITPKVTDFTVGMHIIELSKEGYASASSPLEVSGDEVEGGGITFELGGMSNDTAQLRDGTTLLGDVVSMSMTSVVIRVNGKEQKYDRNQVKKIILVERQVQQMPVVQPVPSSPTK